ncbi:cell envelope integrity protein CreD [Campylobacter coli]|nr:cell envelope integrity protein CreD [Campylobacter coli]
MEQKFDENKFMQEYARNQRLKSLTLKGVLIFIISIVLLIPLLMLKTLVEDRKYNAQNVISLMGKAWGSDEFYTPSLNEKILPNKLELWVDLKYQERIKGIYKIPLYTAFVDFNASFNMENLSNFDENSIQFSNGNLKDLQFNILKDVLWVSGTLQLKGYSSFDANMQAKENIIHINSNATNPSFEYALPNDYSIDKKGFSAFYEFQNSISNDRVEKRRLSVEFYQGVDEYRLIDRMIKYGYLFIILTFLVLFLCELASKKNVILLQYAILGASLIVFYLMLLSFSERIGFNFAYLFSSLAIIIPLSLYTLSIMGQKRFAIVMATILFILYLCLFIMLKQDEYALLIGTFIAMFGIYAAMYFTRNLNKDYHQG